MSALASARLAVALVPTLISGDQEHERALGAWQTEWVALPQLFRHTAGAVGHVRQLLAGLEVHDDRMRRNLALAGGTLMAEALTVAIAAKLGRHEAQRIVKAECERALRDGITLEEAAIEDTCTAGVLSREEIERALDPTQYLGSSDAFIDLALASFRERP
jgi:3-carboxy-cis,cis-muconate cycloisomerase